MSKENELAVLSAEIYKPGHKGQTPADMNLPDGYELIEFVQGKESTEYALFACERDNTLNHITRGTQEVMDFITDSRLTQVVPEFVTKTDALVHEGFHSAYMPNRDKSMKLIDKYSKGIDMLWVAGHSLGAAIGSEVVLDVAINTDIPASGLTIGSPRVFNEPLTALFDKRVLKNIRYVNGADPVPDIILEHIKINEKIKGTRIRIEVYYKHVKGEVQLVDGPDWLHYLLKWCKKKSIFSYHTATEYVAVIP